MGQMKTPGVYIVEKSAFPNSVVEVATAVPAFIGHTERADNGGKSLKNKPWRITSMAEYHRYFGGAPYPEFSIQKKTTEPEADCTIKGEEYMIAQKKGAYLLYYSMLLFYQNGGGPCYIVSVGDYTTDVDADTMKNGIDQLIKEQEPTMVVVPEAVLLAEDNCINVQQAMLQHCGGKMKNRFAILDVYNGFQDRKNPAGDCINNFRNKLGINYLDYAAAYYPWINTTIVQDKDLSYENIDNKPILQEILRKELDIPETGGMEAQPPAAEGQTTEETPPEGDESAEEKSPETPPQQPIEIQDPKKRQLAEAIADITNDKLDLAHRSLLNKTLITASLALNTLLREVKNKLNLLPPSTAMAGIYTMVDNARGVWKAPANVSVNAAVSPAVNISHDDQEDLNVTVQGKSINAIRPFIGEGVLVWGARTLDGNSLDWRYVNVRRTMIMLEESIRLATKAYVFENNVANTWVTIKSMIGNFLTGIWKRGGLAGAIPSDAFSVHVGLGETMTPEDILEGILRVTVLVALIRPAEFIEITFQQQMQKS
jgi:phage tail sheath protein FI